MPRLIDLLMGYRGPLDLLPQDPYGLGKGTGYGLQGAQISPYKSPYEPTLAPGETRSAESLRAMLGDVILATGSAAVPGLGPRGLPKQAPGRVRPGHEAEFAKWFEGSKAVDAEGKPLTVYHATKSAFTSFDPNSLGKNTGAPSARQGFFFASEPINSYASTINPQTGRNEGFPDSANVVPVHLSMKNPLILRLGETGESFPKIIERAKANGHDGIIWRGEPKPSDPTDPFLGTEAYADTYFVFKPEQIKSATGNRGTYSRTSKDIRE